MVFAHRGMSAFAPENTLSAFRLAMEAGADGIELDVQLSSDNELIVIHDHSLQRIAGINKKVDHLSLVEIKSLDAGKWFDPKFTGEKIPTLREVFEIANSKLLINVELKGSNLILVDRLVDLITNFNNSSQIIISSFNSKMLEKVRFLLPDIQIGLLALPNIAGFWHRNITNGFLKPNALHVYYKDVSVKMVKKAHRSNQTVHAYTVNDRADMEKLFSMKVDMIFTDDPKLGLEVREAYLS